MPTHSLLTTIRRKRHRPDTAPPAGPRVQTDEIPASLAGALQPLTDYLDAAGQIEAISEALHLEASDTDGEHDRVFAGLVADYDQAIAHTLIGRTITGARLIHGDGQLRLLRLTFTDGHTAAIAGFHDGLITEAGTVDCNAREQLTRQGPTAITDLA